jgi:hypothetical protein
VFGWLQADTVAAVWIAAAAIHREKNTVEAAAAAGLQPQQAAANKLIVAHIYARTYVTGEKPRHRWMEMAEQEFYWQQGKLANPEPLDALNGN